MVSSRGHNCHNLSFIESNEVWQYFHRAWPYINSYFFHLQGLLLNVKPDVFSILKVYSIQETDVGPDDKLEPLFAAEKDQSCFPCSSQSSDCSGSANSVSTEDLALSGLLSRSSFEEEDSLQSAGCLPVEPPGMLQPACDNEEKRSVFGAGKQEEAYVTMSSFYQINKSVQKEWGSKTLFWML